MNNMIKPPKACEIVFAFDEERLHSSYAFSIRAYTHVKVEFALHPTYEITKFIKGQHSVLCMI
jgi:hypothetical protein